MNYLLVAALLSIPFEFTTPKGFTIQHNGAKVSLAMVDTAFDDEFALWTDNQIIKNLKDLIPKITRITVLPMTVQTSCKRSVVLAVVNNSDLRGYTIVLSGEIDPKDLPTVLQTAFDWEFQIMISKKQPSAWVEPGCLD